MKYKVTLSPAGDDAWMGTFAVVASVHSISYAVTVLVKLLASKSTADVFEVEIPISSEIHGRMASAIASTLQRDPDWEVLVYDGDAAED